MALACALKSRVIDRNIVLEVLSDLNLESIIEGENDSNVNTAIAKEQRDSHVPSMFEGPPQPSYAAGLRKLVPRAAATVALVLAAVTCVDRAEMRTMSNFETASTSAVHEEAASILAPADKLDPLSIQGPAPGVAPGRTPANSHAKSWTTPEQGAVVPHASSAVAGPTLRDSVGAREQ
jgi:hypothetical protein